MERDAWHEARAQRGAAAGQSWDEPEDVELEDADSRLFEAELRTREARLGPEHPQVAEALTNLAIMHNQVCARRPLERKGVDCALRRRRFLYGCSGPVPRGVPAAKRLPPSRDT